MSEAEAALYEVPFSYVKEHVKTCPLRRTGRKRAGISGSGIGTHAPPCGRRSTACRATSLRPRVAKHRLFVWLDARVCPD